jgi:hypothetical protein
MRRRVAITMGVLMCELAVGAAGADGTNGTLPAPDGVVERVREHVGATTYGVVRVIKAPDIPPELWRRVKHLVAFRIHRHRPDGTTSADPAIYLVATSAVYSKAAAALRTGTTSHEYIWCLLAAVFAHEAAHISPNTERQALTAEAAQLRRCLFAGHLHAADGWSAVSYLGKVEAKLRNPREHY